MTLIFHSFVSSVPFDNRMLSSSRAVPRVLGSAGIPFRCLTTSAFAMGEKKKVAVVLSGCGVYDGSEVQESVFALNQLSKLDCAVQVFAPDIDQMHVVDHTKGAPDEGAKRNVLQESARIARGFCLGFCGT